jgi:hypothetical protein
MRPEDPELKTTPLRIRLRYLVGAKAAPPHRLRQRRLHYAVTRGAGSERACMMKARDVWIDRLFTSRIYSQADKYSGRTAIPQTILHDRCFPMTTSPSEAALRASVGCENASMTTV